MIVPNFIPDPLEVPGNVTEQPYTLRLKFIRSVTWLYLVSICLLGLLMTLPMPRIGPWMAAAGLASVLIALEVWRIIARGKDIEGTVSAAMLPVVLVAVALVLSEFRAAGWPVWQLLVGPTCAVIYTALCGRDYSFLGNFALSLIASAVVVAGVGDAMHLTIAQAAFAQATNLALLSYFLYDLASLLSRRRMSEQLAAVTDLYRDVLNFFGYFIRVVKHWQRHRIWSLPSQEWKWKGKG
ncbi:MAG: hypothetical protein ACAH95_05945 [Fimbriimonas sp.]